MQPDDIRMVDVPDEGLRPVTRTGADTREALKACPGIELEHRDFSQEPSMNRTVDAWGPNPSMWEGGAADEALRFAGSSGGAASALAVHALENLDFRARSPCRLRSGCPLHQSDGRQQDSRRGAESLRLSLRASEPL